MNKEDIERFKAVLPHKEAASMQEVVDRSTTDEAAEKTYYVTQVFKYPELKNKISQALIEDVEFNADKALELEKAFKKKTLKEYRAEYKRYLNHIRKYLAKNSYGVEKTDLSGHSLGLYSLAELAGLMTSAIVGFNVLEDAINDVNTNDIFVNAWNDIYVEDNEGIKPYGKSFYSETEYNNFIMSLLFEDDRQLDEGAHKIQDFEIYGLRGNVVHDAVSEKGITLTIRKHAENPITLGRMVEQGMFDERVADFLRMITIGECGTVFCGLTGSGKTTALKAVYEDALSEETLKRFDVQARNKHIIVCEDTPELSLRTPNTVIERTVTTRDEETTITLDRLIINSLRQRPRYVIVGECRGPKEIAAFVDLINSGHGGATSLHAGNPEEAASRLVERYMETQSDIRTELAREFIGGAVDYLVQIYNVPDKRIGRKLTEISEIGFNHETEKITFKTIVEYDAEADKWIWRNGFGKKQRNTMIMRGVPAAKIREFNDWIKENSVKDDE